MARRRREKKPVFPQEIRKPKRIQWTGFYTCMAFTPEGMRCDRRAGGDGFCHMPHTPSDILAPPPKIVRMTLNLSKDLTRQIKQNGGMNLTLNHQKNNHVSAPHQKNAPVPIAVPEDPEAWMGIFDSVGIRNVENLLTLTEELNEAGLMLWAIAPEPTGNETASLAIEYRDAGLFFSAEEPLALGERNKKLFNDILKHVWAYSHVFVGAFPHSVVARLVYGGPFLPKPHGKNPTRLRAGFFSTPASGTQNATRKDDPPMPQDQKTAPSFGGVFIILHLTKAVTESDFILYDCITSRREIQTS